MSHAQCYCIRRFWVKNFIIFAFLEIFGRIYIFRDNKTQRFDIYCYECFWNLLICRQIEGLPPNCTILRILAPLWHNLTRQTCVPSSIGFCLLVALGLERWILFIPRMKMNLASRHLQIQHHQQQPRRTRSSSQSSMSSTSSVSSAASSCGTVSQNIKKYNFLEKHSSDISTIF